MKTPSAKTNQVDRAWFVVDARDAVLGRLATRVATVLRGKHKPIYTPHIDTGDFVIVVNAEHVKLTGKKTDQKKYWHYTGFPGGARGITARKQGETHPDRTITHAVKGMLPKGPLGRQMLKKLKVYAGDTHPHAAQQPQTLS